MKTFKIIISLVLFSIISCKESTHKSDNNLNDTIPNEESIEISETSENKDFIIIPKQSSFTNEPTFQGNGPSFFLNFDIKNNTSYTIDKFLVNVKIVAEFKDSAFETFPEKERDINVGVNEFNAEQYLQNFKIHNFKKYPSDFHIGTLEKDEKWNSGAIKNFDLIISDTQLGPHDSRAYFNINPKVFERTPKSVYLIFHYRAIGIDDEYENVEVYDILEFWKDYQTEIGLR